MPRLSGTPRIRDVSRRIMRRVSPDRASTERGAHRRARGGKPASFYDRGGFGAECVDVEVRGAAAPAVGAPHREEVVGDLEAGPLLPGHPAPRRGGVGGGRGG